MTFDSLKAMGRKAIPAEIALAFEERDGFLHITLTDDAESPTMAVSLVLDESHAAPVAQAAFVDAVIRYTKLQEERAFAAQQGA